jgi:hypothetical protein
LQVLRQALKADEDVDTNVLLPLAVHDAGVVEDHAVAEAEGETYSGDGKANDEEMSDEDMDDEDMGDTGSAAQKDPTTAATEGKQQEVDGQPKEEHLEVMELKESLTIFTTHLRTLMSHRTSHTAHVTTATARISCPNDHGGLRSYDRRSLMLQRGASLSVDATMRMNHDSNITTSQFLLYGGRACSLQLAGQ